MRLGMIARVAVAGAVALTTVTAMSSTAANAAPAKPASSVVADNDQGTLASTVDGTFGDGGTVTGTFTPTAFAVENDVLQATGTLHAVLTNPDGSSAGTSDSTVTLPVQVPGSSGASANLAATCSILHLVLGPLNLNLLGLNVHLNTVVLDITAVSGPGNLLGNLLCAVAGLLDGTGLPGLLGQLADLLNQILGLLSL